MIHLYAAPFALSSWRIGKSNRFIIIHSLPSVRQVCIRMQTSDAFLLMLTEDSCIRWALLNHSSTSEGIGSLAQLLHLLVQQAAEEVLGDDLAIVQARLVTQPLPNLRQNHTSKGLRPQRQQAFVIRAI